MSSEIAVYRMSEPGNPKRSYDYLYGSLMKHVRAEVTDKNRAALIAAKNSSSGRSAAMAGLEAGNPPDSRDPPRDHGDQPPEDKTTRAAPASKEHNAGAQKDVMACFLHKKGICKRGDQCRYSHDPGAKIPKVQFEKLDKAFKMKQSKLTTERRAVTPCTNYAKGECKFGDACQFAHDPPKMSTACCLRAGPKPSTVDTHP